MQNEERDIDERIWNAIQCKITLEEAVQRGCIMPETYQQEIRWLNDQLGRLRARKEELRHAYA